VTRRPLILLFTLPCGAQDSPFAQVLAEVQKIHGEAGLRNASLGFALIPVAAKSPDALTGYHPDLALLPASTLKVVTAATALELLGSDFRFETVLQHTGVIEDDGTLKGDAPTTSMPNPSIAFSARRRGWEAPRARHPKSSPPTGRERRSTSPASR